MYVLVKFDDNWADEMDLSGFRVMGAEDYEEWQKALKLLTFPYEPYFGTNENTCYADMIDFQRTLDTQTISDEDAAVIINLFGKKYGHFPSIEDHVDWDDEELS